MKRIILITSFFCADRRSDVFAAELYVLAELSFGLFVSETQALVHFVRILKEIEKDDLPLTAEYDTR